MQLSPALQGQVRGIAKDPDLTQDCFLVLLQRSEAESSFALRIAKQVCVEQWRKEQVHVSAMSTDHPDFVEPVCQAESVDVDRYVDKIKNQRLQAIVNQYIDGETLSHRDVVYLGRHRYELNRDLRKYLKQKSTWQILVEKIEPFRRSLRQLKDESVRLAILRAQ